MLWDLLVEPFAGFGFMRRALVGCAALSLGVSPVGVLLTLRRMSLAGDALSHGVLPGVAIGYYIAGLSVGAMAFGGLVAGAVVAGLAGLVSRATALREDASLAAFYLSSLAFGVVLISARGDAVDLRHILFGGVLALDDTALVLIAASTSLSLITLALLFRPIALEAADPGFLRSASGLSAVAHFVFLALVVINLVAGFTAIGAMMSVGLMVLPAVSARFLARELGAMMAVAALIAFTASAVGLLVSFHFGLAAGPSIVLTAGGCYLAAMTFGPVGGLWTRYFPQQHLKE